MHDSEQQEAKRRRFSMLRTFVAADVLTLGNGFCGAGAVLALMQYVAAQQPRWLWLALGMFPLALLLDFADGRVARWRRRSSTLGADLDSLADVISFGMAPAALGFAVGLRGVLDVVALLYFVACGISRLARFNVTAEALADDEGKVRYFEGTPIPTTVLIALVIAWLASQDRIHEQLPFGTWSIASLVLHPFALCYVLSGSAMISTVRIPKL
jgi:CDP-diacylglycerol--serine O-phosphatidyltransferase